MTDRAHEAADRVERKIEDALREADRRDFFLSNLLHTTLWFIRNGVESEDMLVHALVAADLGNAILADELKVRGGRE